jgi:hypothetical protein
MTPKKRPISVVQIVDFIRISVVPTVAGREVPALPIAAHLSGDL